MAETNGFQDPYSDPQTGVLHNKLGLKIYDNLSRVEHIVSAARTVELQVNPIKGDFDLQHLKDIHRYQFNDIYSWAGELRTVNIGKGNTLFCPADQIEEQGMLTHKFLKTEDFLRGMPRDKYIDRFAVYYGEVNMLHPFREGNGRAAREFMGQLAKLSGYELDQTLIENVKNQWNDAAAQTVLKRFDPIKAIFDKALRPGRAVAFEKFPEQEAVARYPELKNVYKEYGAVLAGLEQRFPEQKGLQEGYALGVRKEILYTLEKGKLPAGFSKGEMTGFGMQTKAIEQPLVPSVKPAVYQPSSPQIPAPKLSM